jgi:hypothetical protein
MMDAAQGSMHNPIYATALQFADGPCLTPIKRWLAFHLLHDTGVGHTHELCFGRMFKILPVVMLQSKARVSLRL